MAIISTCWSLLNKCINFFSQHFRLTCDLLCMLVLKELFLINSTSNRQKTYTLAFHNAWIVLKLSATAASFKICHMLTSLVSLILAGIWNMTNRKKHLVVMHKKPHLLNQPWDIILSQPATPGSKYCVLQIAVCSGFLANFSRNFICTRVFFLLPWVLWLFLCLFTIPLSKPLYRLA